MLFNLFLYFAKFRVLQIAVAGGGEAIGVVGLDGEGAEVGVRLRQELTGEEENDGDRAPVKDWRRMGS
jgi:hypothetical protein